MNPSRLSRRNFLKQFSHAGTAVVIAPIFLTSISCKTERKPDRRQQTIDYLLMDSAEVNRQDQLKEKFLQEIEPVVLAEPGETPYDHQHLGWPVATMVDDTIVVAFKTWPGKEWHSKGKIPYRGPIIVNSVDGGKSWSQPIYPHEQNDIKMIFPDIHPGMLALGTTTSGKIIFAHRENVFISEDKGKKWKHHISEGLSGNGPRIINHPKYGLIHPGRTGGELLFFVSEDEGYTWKKKSLPVDESKFRLAEPTIFAWDKKFAFLIRNHSGPSTGSFGYFRTWSYHAQFIPTNIDSAKSIEDLNFDYGLSNIFVRRMDTNDVIYNPVTKRIEAVVTKRNEGFPYRDFDYMTLNLWSIDPDKFIKGHADWRFECVLLRSKGKKSRSFHPEFPPQAGQSVHTPGSNAYHPEFPPIDGMHPAGSVVDEKRGMQHIFIYYGNRTHSGPDSGKTGVFRISRTLDTDKLRDESRKLDNFDKIFQVNESFDTLDDWTPSGRPLMLWVEYETVNRDIVRKLKEPLPNGLVRTDEHGLYIKTNMPGYYGLHNENTIVTHNYKLEFKAKIERYAIEGDSLGININYGAQRQHFILRKDGLYELAGPDKPRRIKEMHMDNNWHVWNIEMNKGKSEIYMDGTHVANSSAMIDDRLGRNDAPINIYVRTIDPSDPVEMRMEYFKFENLEVDLQP